MADFFVAIYAVRDILEEGELLLLIDILHRELRLASLADSIGSAALIDTIEIGDEQIGVLNQEIVAAKEDPTGVILLKNRDLISTINQALVARQIELGVELSLHSIGNNSVQRDIGEPLVVAQLADKLSGRHIETDSHTTQEGDMLTSRGAIATKLQKATLQSKVIALLIVVAMTRKCYIHSVNI